MASEKQITGTIALLGAAAVAVVVVLLGVLHWDIDRASAPRDTAPQASRRSQPSRAPDRRRNGARPRLKPPQPSPRRRPPAAPPKPAATARRAVLRRRAGRARTATASSPAAPRRAPPSSFCATTRSMPGPSPTHSGLFAFVAAAAAARLAPDRPAIDRAGRHAPALAGSVTVVIERQRPGRSWR